MARTLKFDKTLFLVTLLLVGASLVMVYSASFAKGADEFKSEYYFLYRQIAWAIVGFAAMSTAAGIDYREYRRPVFVWGVVGVVAAMLLAVLVVGHPINGTLRWISFGSVSLQPSEFAKIAAVLFTASHLARRMHRIHEPGAALLPVVIVTLGLVALILREPDFGTSAVIVAVVMAMVFAAGLRYRHLLLAAVPIVAGAGLLVWIEPYRLRRLFSFLDPWADRFGDGYQAVQSELAIASGGVLGRGLMAGQQKLYYLPEAHTDYIFSVVAEELGLIGTTLLIGCYAIIAWRGLRVALLAPDRFGSFLALGLTLIIAIQALVNVGVATAILPTKGLPLPFISNGGSSLLVNMLAMGILLNISQHASPLAASSSATQSNWTFGPSGGLKANS